MFSFQQSANFLRLDLSIPQDPQFCTRSTPEQKVTPFLNAD